MQGYEGSRGEGGKFLGVSIHTAFTRIPIMHDEIIVEVREDIADDVAAVAKECMEGTFAEIFTEVLFVVNPENGTRGMRAE